MANSDDKTVWILDYGAGNVRSLVNAVMHLGYNAQYVTSPDQLKDIQCLIFPGVGAFGSALSSLRDDGYLEPLREYVQADKPFFGICVGMQCLFKGSEESPGIEGLGVIPTMIKRFSFPPSTSSQEELSVPHIGWNGVNICKTSTILPEATDERYYFVHSYMALPEAGNEEWVSSITNYGTEFISSVAKGRIMATQYHPEKSSKAGLNMIKRFLEKSKFVTPMLVKQLSPTPTVLAKRIIACLDVRANDSGDLVVTKGDQYDVREKTDSNEVRNLGKPVELAQRYYTDGADEIAFLNITSFRELPAKDLPILALLKEATKKIFVPLTVGGGIRDTTDPDGSFHSAVDVASMYFSSGADKVSIGSDAVLAAEEFYKRGGSKTGKSCIEQIAYKYGAQAVVVSVDPKRVYCKDPSEYPDKHVIGTSRPGPNGEMFCWYQVTIKGGRETRDLDAWALVRACEALGAGEILLNCMDHDGCNDGYDLDLIGDIKRAVSIPVIASSGAGNPVHFTEVFRQTNVDAGLAAGIFHRNEYSVAQVKQEVNQSGIPIRL
eukprot:CFRG7500T1